MEVRRTILPIGQGAFYAEQLSCGDGSKVNVVYDCGCEMKAGCPQSAVMLIRNWCNSLPKAHRQIDLLFISHFHSDHVNGIRTILESRVTVKNVIMPYIHKDIAEGLDNLVTQYYFGSISSGSAFINPYTTLFSGMQNPPNIFYSVREGEQDVPFPAIEIEGGQVGGRTISLSQLSSSGHPGGRRLPSGTSISKEEWMYRAFNLPYKDTLDKAIQALNDRVAELEAEHGHEWLNDRNSIYEVRELYKNIQKNINDTSLMVLSAPVDVKKNNLAFNVPSCLYTGDITLTDEVLDLIGLRVLPYHVGTFQIPHHGSLNSWNVAVLGKTYISPCMVPFLSCGNKNGYKHPHKDVLEDFHCIYKAIRIVKELPNTKFEQEFHI